MVLLVYAWSSPSCWDIWEVTQKMETNHVSPSPSFLSVYLKYLEREEQAVYRKLPLSIE